MKNSGLDEAQAGIKNARRNINNLRYANDTALMAEIAVALKIAVKTKLRKIYPFEYRVPKKSKDI